MKSKLFKILFCFLVVSLFFSCKNFQNGDELFEELTKAIDYANADYVKLEIKVDFEKTKSITPFSGVYDAKFKRGDSFNISYEPISEYKFECWAVTPENAVTFSDANSLNTTITIVKDSEPIVIEPICKKYLSVTQVTPGYDSVGVNCGSLIKVFFDQPVNDPSNIYWTYDELAEMGHAPNYADTAAKFFNEKQGTFTRLTIDNEPVDETDPWDDIKRKYYYFGYEENNKLIMKNIEVSVTNNGQVQSLLTLYKFMSPYFENQNVLVIPPRKNQSYMGIFESLPPNSDITVTVKSGIKGVEGEKLKEDFTFYYKTSGEYDVVPPSGSITSILGYNTVEPFYRNDNKSIQTSPDSKQAAEIMRRPADIKTYDRDEELKTIQNATTVDELLKFGLKPVKHLAFIGNDTIKDDENGCELRSVTVELVPVKCKAYENEAETIYKTKTYYGKKDINLLQPEDSILFDFPEEARNGVYRIYLYATDMFGNTSEIPVYVENGNMGIAAQYCIYDNTPPELGIIHTPTPATIGKDTSSIAAVFKLPVGTYLFVKDNLPTDPRSNVVLINKAESYYENAVGTGTIVEKGELVTVTGKESNFSAVTKTLQKAFTQIIPSGSVTSKKCYYYICTEDKVGNFHLWYYKYENSQWKITKYCNGKKIS